MRIYIFFYIFLFSYFNSASAVTCDLKQCIDYAKIYNSEIKKLRAEFSAFQEQENLTFSSLLPSVGVSVSRSNVNQERSDGTSSKLKQNYVTESDTMSLTQPIYRPRLFKELNKVRYQIDSEKFSLMYKEDVLVTKVARQYFTILDQKNRNALIEKRIRLLNEQLTSVEKSISAGTGTITELAEFKAALDRARADRIIFGQALKLALNELSLLVGKEIKSIKSFTYSEKAFKNFKLDNLKEWENNALENNLNSLAAKRKIKAAEAALSSEKYNRYPSLDMSIQFARGSSESTFFVDSETTTKSIGLSIFLPIYQGGSLSSKVRQSVEFLNAEKEGFNFQQEELKKQVQRSYYGVVENFSLNKALQTALESANIEVEANKKSVEAGYRRRLDVLISQQKAITVEQELSSARIKLILNWLELIMISGTLNNKTLDKVNKIFN